MSEPRQLRPRIEGWKEIARYFDRSVRAVQDWERDGLPVHRFQSRVWAYVDELERFQSSQDVPTPTPVGVNPTEISSSDAPPVALPPERTTDPEITLKPSGPSRLILTLSLAGVVAIGLITSLVWIAAANNRRLIRFEFSGKLLRVFDDHDRVAWTHVFDGAPTPEPEGSRISLLADIDGDGRAELLFVERPPEGGSILYCFRSDGRLAWQFPIGRSIVDGRGHPILNNYRTIHLGLLKKPRSDGGRIVVSSHHVFSWPHQILVLTPQGKPVAEYWHPGWLFAMAIADLNNDGVEEILLGGVNDSYRDIGGGATLLVLDSRFTSAQGPARPGDTRQAQGIPAGQPLATLLFAEIDKRQETKGIFSRIELVSVVDGHLEVHEVLGPDLRIHYQLDRRLRVVNITPTPEVLQRVAPNASADERDRRVWSTFGHLNTLKNDFAFARQN